MKHPISIGLTVFGFKITTFRPLVKSAYQNISFLFFQPENSFCDTIDCDSDYSNSYSDQFKNEEPNKYSCISLSEFCFKRFT